MIILKVYDTMREARQECKKDYLLFKNKGVRCISPYRLEFGYDRYMYISRNNTDYILGARFDSIEDYTTKGLPPEAIMACQKKPFEREYEARWYKE